MPSLVSSVTPTLDGPALTFGDGVVRRRSIRIASGYTPPFYVRLDKDPAKVYKIEALPVTLVVDCGQVEILTGEASPPTLGLVPTPGPQFFVSTTGGTGTGSIENPWSFSHALSGGAGAVVPGSVIWMRGGTYGPANTIFEPTHAHGTPNARITFRQYGGDAPLGERVIINGQIQVERDYTDWRGMEIAQTNPVGSLLTGIIQGVQSGSADAARIINCIIHDCGQQGGTGWLESRGPSMYYGCIIYNNGTVYNKDHGLYMHDEEKVVENCITFNNVARGIQVYDSSRDHKHIMLKYCISFGNGEIKITTNDANTNFLMRVKAPRISQNYVMESCVGYHKPGAIGSRQFRFGTAGNLGNQLDCHVFRNYWWNGHRPFGEIAEWKDLEFVENTLVGTALETADIVILHDLPYGLINWQKNNWYIDPTQKKWKFKGIRRNWEDFKTKTGLGATDTATITPPKNKVFVFPNTFEPGRGHMAICNHEGLSSVLVPAAEISKILQVGDRYEIRNVQDLWGTPVVDSTFDGDDVDVSMAGVAPPALVDAAGRGLRVASTTAPDFDAFLVLKVG